MARRQKAAADGFNLAFLDVMACGLGAVILIFMLVDFQELIIDVTEEAKKLQQQFSASEDQQSQLQKSIDEVNDRIAMETSLEEAERRKNEQTLADLDALKKAIAEQQAVIADLEDAKAAVLEKTPEAAPIPKTGQGEQNYIVGMPVTGRNIGLLIDHSASMMGVTLVDIFLAMGLPTADKQTQPKWVKTRNIVTWLLSRMPQTAKVTAVTFSEKADTLGNKAVISRAINEDLQSIATDFLQVEPQGGSNLDEGLKALMAANPDIDAIYIVTDGLPTKGPGCRKLTTPSTISAQCRAEKGRTAFNNFFARHRKVKVSTILLPIEGDPFAAAVYWEAARRSGGRTLSPAEEWN